VLGAIGLLLTACGGSGAAPKPAEAQAEAAQAAETAAETPTAEPGPKWSYSGDDGPEHWADADPQFAACGVGKAQSPINLPQKAEPSSFASIDFRYQPTKLNISNTGKSLTVTYDPGSSLVVDDREYALEQFHFHVPGEHHLNGLEFPMEAHLVHRAADGELLVVAIMFYGGVINKPQVMATVINTPALDSIWQQMPAAGSQVGAADSVNVADLLPVDRTYMTYQGSLTTPPCSEGVRWIVLTTPSVVGPDHLEKFRTLVGRNNRPIQPLNGRLIQSGYAQVVDRSQSASPDAAR